MPGWNTARSADRQPAPADSVSASESFARPSSVAASRPHAIAPLLDGTKHYVSEAVGSPSIETMLRSTPSPPGHRGGPMTLRDLPLPWAAGSRGHLSGADSPDGPSKPFATVVAEDARRLFRANGYPTARKRSAIVPARLSPRRRKRCTTVRLVVIPISDIPDTPREHDAKAPCVRNRTISLVFGPRRAAQFVPIPTDPSAPIPLLERVRPPRVGGLQYTSVLSDPADVDAAVIRHSAQWQIRL